MFKRDFDVVSEKTVVIGVENDCDDDADDGENKLSGVVASCDAQSLGVDVLLRIVDIAVSTVEDAANFAANALMAFEFGVIFAVGVDFLSSSCFFMSARRSLTVITFGSSVIAENFTKTFL